MKYIFGATLILFLLSVRFLISHNENLQISQEEKLVDKILENAAALIKKKYNIQPSGKGASMPEGVIHELTLTFDSNEELSKHRLRELLIDSAKELVAQVKMDRNIEQFLANPPFTIKNAQIIIYNYDRKGRALHDPKISTSEISCGILTYRTLDPKNRFKLKNQFKETLEEALKTMRKCNCS